MLGGATSQKFSKKRNCKKHDTSTIIPPLAMSWVSKEAVWSTLVHLFDLDRCFPAKIEQTLKIFQKNKNTIQWIFMVFVGFLNFISFWLKNSRHNKQIIVSWAFPLLYILQGGIIVEWKNFRQEIPVCANLYIAYIRIR